MAYFEIHEKIHKLTDGAVAERNGNDRGCHHDQKKLEAQAENRENSLSVCIALLKEFNSNRKVGKGYQGWGDSLLTV